LPNVIYLRRVEIEEIIGAIVYGAKVEILEYWIITSMADVYKLVLRLANAEQKTCA
jgi:hypothetical protein